MTNRIRIVSDGLVGHTKVLLPDGTELPGVVGVEILNLHANHRDELVQARVTLASVEVDVTAEHAGGGLDRGAPGG